MHLNKFRMKAGQRRPLWPPTWLTYPFPSPSSGAVRCTYIRVQRPGAGTDKFFRFFTVLVGEAFLTATKMANQTLLNLIMTEMIPNSWESDCIAKLNTSSTFHFTHGLVNGYGEHMSHLTNATWGIGFETCSHQCNHNEIPFVRQRATVHEMRC